MMDAFCRLALGRSATLVEAALVVASDEYPDLDIPLYLEQVELMAQGFAIVKGNESEPRKILERLSRFFCEELEFDGDRSTYHDPKNSYLNDVIDRRRGIPISLSVLYQVIAASAGVRLTGVDLPGHFMLSYRGDEGERVYIDVFNHATFLNWDECRDRVRSIIDPTWSGEPGGFDSMADRDVLRRILRNLKGIYSKSDLARCLRTQERIVQLDGKAAAELRDLGIMYYYAGKPLHAMRTLQKLLTVDPPSGDTDAVKFYLRRSTQDAVLLN